MPQLEVLWFLGTKILKSNFTIYFTVTWYKDGTPIEEGSSKYEFVQDGKKFRLKILSSTSLDMGQYIVKATDKTGESTAAFSVNVYSSSEV